MLEGIVTEPVGEESQAASRHHSCAISHADRDTMQEVKVETPADDEQSPPSMESVCRVYQE